MARIGPPSGTCDWCRNWFESLIRISYNQFSCERCYPQAYEAAIKSHPEQANPLCRERPLNPEEWMMGLRIPQFPNGNCLQSNAFNCECRMKGSYLRTKE